MIGKLIVYGANRTEALDRMGHALARFKVVGIGTTLAFLEGVMAHPEFRAGRVSTSLVGQMLNERSSSTAVSSP
jgi:acetyl/propionyl-CoA carboxylase alpha subunit